MQFIIISLKFKTNIFEFFKEDRGKAWIDDSDDPAVSKHIRKLFNELYKTILMIFWLIGLKLELLLSHNLIK
jgi:hypothetical protein